MSRFFAVGGAALAVGLALTSVSAFAAGNQRTGGAPAAPSAAVGDLGMSVMSAAINVDGTLARGEGVTSSGRLSAGSGFYEIFFGRDVSACVYVAATGLTGPDGNPPAGYATVVRRIGTQNGVFISTFDSAGQGADFSFHILVYCGR